MRQTLNRSAVSTVVLLLAGACAQGPGTNGAEPAGLSPLLYIANQEAAAITVVDPASGDVVEVLDLDAMGYGAAAKPHHIAVEPDGSFWYVSLIGANTVLKFDRANDLVAAADFEVPGLLALDPDSDWLFVGRSMAAVNPPQRIGRIDRSTMTAEEFDVFIPRPHAIALGPAGTVYAGSLAENSIAVVDRATGNTDLVRFEGGMPGMPHTLVQIAVSPDERTLVATGEMSGTLIVFSIDGDGMPTYEREVAVGAAPWHPVFTPDGSEVWMGTQGDDRVVVVDTGTWEIAAMIQAEGISEPHGSVISTDGSRVWVASRNVDGLYAGDADFGYAEPTGTVVEIDTASREVVRVVETPPYAAGLGLGTGPIATGAGAEVSWSRVVDPFPVTGRDGRPMDHPFLGGFNAPRPQLADLDGDGDADLVVQESTDRLLFFEATGPDAGGLPTYSFRPDVFRDLEVGEWFRFVDVDGDGDRDLLSEQPFSYVQVHGNTAETGLPRFEVIADTIKDTRGEPIFSDRQNIPNAADLDCDGALDLLIGRLAGTITHYEATGILSQGSSPFRLVSDRFQNIEIVADPMGTETLPTQQQSPLGALPRNAGPDFGFGGSDVRPTLHGANTMALADIDGDGDVDLFWGDFFEPGLLYIENTGSCQAPNLRGEPVPFPEGDPITTSGYNAPTFGDTDGDGVLDLVMGVLGGAYNPNTTTAENLFHFSGGQDGSFVLDATRLIRQIDVGSESAPMIVDLDGDGDLDVLVSNRIDPADPDQSRIYRFENVGSPTRPELQAAGTLEVPGEFHKILAFGDLDGDGDLDAVLGTWRQDLYYLENTGSETDAAFLQSDAPIAALTRGSNAVPALGDLDGDGDLDLVVGEAAGTLSFFENTGSGSDPVFELVTDTYLDVDLGRRTYPVLVDLDGDGDLDLAVGTEDAGIVYYENTGSGTDPVFERGDPPLPATGEFPALVSPAFGDMDGDGDLEMVAGGAGGGLYYFDRDRW